MLGRKLLAGCAIAMTMSLTACQFQPLYSSAGVSGEGMSRTLSSVSVGEVATREAQQVRNHLIFLMSGGSSPSNPTHEVRLRVTSTVRNLAGRISNQETNQIGNTAGSIAMTVSYDLYRLEDMELVHRGTRTANAAFDETSQSFATERAQRDAVDRAALAVAEQLRLAIASDLAGDTIR